MSQHPNAWNAAKLKLRLTGTDDPDACWEWAGYRDAKNYGRTSFYGKAERTHRVAWQLFFGPIPNGMCVLHRCDNPPCCNPAHLFLGTRPDNARDCADKGRKPGFKGVAHHMAKLTDADVAAIRAAWDAAPKKWGMLTRLSRQYDVADITILRVVKRRNWTHLP